MGYTYTDILAIIESSYSTNQSSILFKKNKKVSLICAILIQEGLLLKTADVLLKRKLNLRPYLRVFLKYNTISTMHFSLGRIQGLNSPSAGALSFPRNSFKRPYKKLLINSKPGYREYISFSDLQLKFCFSKLLILSTDKGLMTNHQGLKLRTGGELLCTIYL